MKTILTILLFLVGAGGAVLAHQYGPLRMNAAARARLGGAAECVTQSRPARRPCYRKTLTAEVARTGVAGAIAALQTLAKVDIDVNRDGHEYAHGIGIEGYLHLKSVPASFEHCPEQFASGCGHGVIQAYLENQTAMDSATINQLCAPYRAPGRTQWQLFQCVHGMGHGLNMMYAGDLPKALGTCDMLGDEWDRASCYGGVFMENIMAEIQPHHPATELANPGSHGQGEHEGHDAFKRLDPSQPLYPCSIMEQKYLQQCYEIQTSAILHFTRGSIGRTAEICNMAPADMRGTCYQSLGRDISGRTRRDPGKTRRLCDQGAEAYRPWCYFGAAKAIVDWDAKAEPGIEFCGELGTARGALFCFRAVGEQIRALGGPTPERERLCAGAARPEAVEACRSGAGLPGSSLPRDES